MIPLPQQSDSIQLQQFMPQNSMLPPPTIAKSINRTAQVAAQVDRQTGRFFKIAILSIILSSHISCLKSSLLFSY